MTEQVQIKYPQITRRLKSDENVYALVYAVETALRLGHVSETERDSFITEVLKESTTYDNAKARMSAWITIEWI